MLLNVRYTIKPGKRDEFVEKVNEHEIVINSKVEPGNYQYE